MTTDNQLTANRENAARSTGPRSEAGKSRSSRNALKHGLSADQVVMFDEDPAVFDALRSDLFDHFQPADPVAAHLVEHVAACIWRIRRVPEIEAGIYTYLRYLRERDKADKRLSFMALQAHTDGDQNRTTRNEEAYKAAIEARKSADAKLLENEPLKGGLFVEAERSLTSLVRIAGAIESSMYRAIRELERIKAERRTATNDNAVIDVEADEGAHPDGQTPSSRAETNNGAMDSQHTQPSRMDTMAS
jgi:hypothetical protein